VIPGLEARLDQLAALNQTTTYGTLARDLGLTGPATIARLTTALESLMDQDAAHNRPFRAAVVNARLHPIPAPGFFQKAAALGRYDGSDPAAFTAAERLALGRGTRP
jgi:hypothetical protein